MNIRKKMAIIFLTFALIIGCSGKAEEQTKPAQKVAVEIDKAKLADITISKTFAGTLEGARQSKIYATIPERIVDIPISEGEYVHAGQPIIHLDKSGVSSQYNQAQAVYLNAKDNFTKMENLYQQKAISEMDFKGAKTAYEVAEANFNAAKGAVDLSVTIDGIVTDIAVNIGDQAPLGVPLATIANIQKMRLTVYVGLDEISKLRAGQTADVYINSDQPVEAKIAEISKSADPETRLFKVELEMNNSLSLLKPGMYAKVKIVVDNLTNVLCVPARAVFNEEGISKVYIVENGVAYARSIEIGANDGINIQVISGLSEGQPVVTVGKSNLRDATPVIVPNKEDSTDVPS